MFLESSLWNEMKDRLFPDNKVEPGVWIKTFAGKKTLNIPNSFPALFGEPREFEFAGKVIFVLTEID